MSKEIKKDTKREEVQRCQNCGVIGCKVKCLGGFCRSWIPEKEGK